MKPFSLLSRYVFLLLSLVLFYVTCSAQQLWGMTSDGGSNKAGGNIFSIGITGAGFQERYAFRADGAVAHWNPLLDDGDGFLYGQVVTDAIKTLSIFKMKPDGSEYQIIHRFETDGQAGGPDLLKGSDGFIYGALNAGGAYNAGILYKIRPDGTGYTVLYSFSHHFCATAAGALTLLPGGFIAGTAFESLPGYGGALYKIKMDGTGFQILHFFSQADGTDPFGVVATTNFGTTTLFGITESNGPAGWGSMYRINPDGSGFQLVHSNLLNRFNRLVTDGSNLFFTNQGGGSNGKGSIWRQNALTGSTRIADLGAEFPSESGKYIGSCFSLALKSGVLYGALSALGDDTIVPLIKLNTDGSGKQILRYVANYNTSISVGAGKVFGLSRVSSPKSVENMYSIGTNGTGFQTIHLFVSPQGFCPTGTLTKNNLGKISGLVSQGGNFTFSGVAFEIDPGTNQYSVLATFPHSGFYGRNPLGALIMASDGKFYGVLHDEYGGYFGGELFRMSLGSLPSGQDISTLQAIKTFSSCNNCGARPLGTLVEGNDGFLYGTLEKGSDTLPGGIFKIRKDGSGYNLLHSFTGAADGSNPTGALVKGPDGNFYGMTENGGSQGWGTIFKISPAGLKTVIFQFGTGSAMYSGANGVHPKGALILGIDGKLYGMATAGGNLMQGTIFRITTDGSGFQVLYHFDGAGGASPEGSLIQDSSGTLFGMATYGGTSNMGTVFRIGSNGTAFQKLFDFNGTNGKYPKGNLLLISAPAIPAARRLTDSVEQKAVSGNSFIVYPNPVASSFHFSIHLKRAGSVSYSLLTPNGQVLSLRKENARSENYSGVVSVLGLPNGIYFFEVVTHDGRFSKRILKE